MDDEFDEPAPDASEEMHHPNEIIVDSDEADGPASRAMKKTPKTKHRTDMNIIAAEEDSGWTLMILEAKKGVVNIKQRVTSIFDEYYPSISQATGFIVDKPRGIILTNRHVVKTTPGRTRILLHNREELDARVVYVDPVHDFAFVKVLPSTENHSQNVSISPDTVTNLLDENDCTQIDLDPDGATVGVPIRVLGNDSGEELSILQGTISRLDRNAPNYRGSYQDFNTFYFGAASATSGGSSGSPVLNRSGKAIALNAGGSTSSSNSFYLPLFQVAKILDCIQHGKRINRGCIQVMFTQKKLVEVRDLGVTKHEEADLLKDLFNVNKLNGLLVVTKMVPGGPGQMSGLKIGDVLLRVNGAPVVEFRTLENILDDACSKLLLNDDVNAFVMLTVKRGTALLEFKVVVCDLLSLNPSEFFLIDKGSFYNLTYNTAIKYQIPLDSVFMDGNTRFAAVAGAGTGVIVRDLYVASVGSNKSRGDRPITLHEIVEILTKANFGEKIVLKTCVTTSIRLVSTSTGILDTRYMTIERVSRQSFEQGNWKIELIRSPEKVEIIKNTDRRQLKFGMAPEDRLKDQKSLEDWIFNSFVTVKFYAQFWIDHLSKTEFSEMGMFVDRAKGLIMTSHFCVPVTIGTVLVTIASEVLIPAKILYCHPTHNISLIQIDMHELSEYFGDSPLPVTEIIPVPREMIPFEKCTFYGLGSGEKRVKQTECHMKFISRFLFKENWPATFALRNTRNYFMHPPENDSAGGYYCNDAGEIFAIRSFTNLNCFDLISEIRRIDSIVSSHYSLADVRVRDAFSVNTLGIILDTKVLAKVRDGYNLSVDRVNKIKAKLARSDIDSKQVLYIGRVLEGAEVAKTLRKGDLLLEINGEVIVDMNDYQNAISQSYANKDRMMQVVIQREQELKVQVPLTKFDLLGTTFAISFNGMMLQPSLPFARYHGFFPETQDPETGGVFVTTIFGGSPAAYSHMLKFIWVISVNSVLIKDMSELLEVIQDIPDDTVTRIETIDRRNNKKVFTLKSDYLFYPTVVLRRDFETLEWDVTRISNSSKL